MSFRLTLTASVMLMIGALAALLIFVQLRTLDLATGEAATSTMDVVSARTVNLLQVQVANLSRATRTLALSPSLANSSTPGETSPHINLIRGAVLQWPALDSIYVGYDDGHWLQVQRIEGLEGEQRERLGAPPDAAFALALIQPTADGALPTTRIFQDKDGKEIARQEIPHRGYDARERVWYQAAQKSGQLVISAPYLSFSLRVPMITFSAALQGSARGVVGAPNPQEDHCERACRAALLAVRANEEINRQFAAEGLPAFHTRYGIHVGEAVVGNLGSAERMNYTVLGNIVNLAARLEGLNKQYGTEILISEDAFERVKDRFRCRYVDSVVAKGMIAHTRVYELLEEIQPGVTDHVSDTQSQPAGRIRTG